MATFTLNLEIDPKSLQVLKDSGQRIILAKPVNDEDRPNVIWQSFDPFQTNDVTWDERFGLYAADADVINGARITKMSNLDLADEAAYYTFTAGASFTGPLGDRNVKSGQYGVLNAMPSNSYASLTFGLTQAATIGGVQITGQPINAAPVPATFFATFTPITTVYAWLESTLTSATVITNIVSKHTIVRYSGSTTVRSLVYDPQTGVFVPAASEKLPDSETTLVRPRFH
jgi:hypothetical protein